MVGRGWLAGFLDAALVGRPEEARVGRRVTGHQASVHKVAAREPKR